MCYRGPLETGSIPLLIGVYFAVYYDAWPNGKVPAGRALSAAVCAAVLTEAVRLLFTWLLPFLHFPEVYGPFAISATLLIWSFIGSLILLWGASFFATGYEADLRASESDALGIPGHVLGLEA